MTSQLFLEIFERDIKKFREEITLYKNENDLWLMKGDIKNPAGTLCLHLTGNLKHFIGAVLGKSGYIRQRDKEFSDRSSSREEMLEGLDEALEEVKRVLRGLNDAELEKDFPIEFMGRRKTGQVLMILLAHLNYHLGQVNYHRRLPA